MRESDTLPILPIPAVTPHYLIAKYRPRRQTRPLQKYGGADLVAYALNVAEEIDSTEKPAIYTDAVSCSDSS